MKHARPDYNRIQDPLGLIPADEPVFLVRGQDLAGPGTVDAWADIASGQGADPKIVGLARAHAEDMRDYQKRTGRGKIADLKDLKAVVAGERPATEVKLGSRALTAILKRSQEAGATVVEATGLMVALAEQAYTEIGRMMAAKNHATMTYELVDQEMDRPVYGLVARVFDQKIVVRLSSDAQDPAVVNLIEQRVTDFKPGDLVETPHGPAEVIHWAKVPPDVDLVAEGTRVPVKVMPGWFGPEDSPWASYLPSALVKYPDTDFPANDARVILPGAASPAVVKLTGQHGNRSIDENPDGVPCLGVRFVKGPAGAVWSNAGHGWTRA